MSKQRFGAFKFAAFAIVAAISICRPLFAFGQPPDLRPSSPPSAALEPEVRYQQRLHALKRFAQAEPQTAPDVNSPAHAPQQVSNVIVQCDTYTASDYDPKRTAPPVPFNKIDPKNAIPACEAAVQQFSDDIRLNFNLGRAYQKANEMSAALDHYKKAADQGFAPAENNVAMMYRNGWGVEPNVGTALVWYQKAAAQDFVLSDYALGQFYENGFGGLRKDPDKAVYWYRKAVDQNFVNAENDLGAMYENGTEIKKDDKQAATLMRKAAKQGLLLARINLGGIYLTAPDTRDPGDLGIILGELARNGERGNSQAASGGRLTWEGRSDDEKVQVGKKLLADAADAAVLENCGLH